MPWTRVCGHNATVEAFRRIIRGDRLAHAYLFAGPEGIGKRCFATELARALLCEDPAASAEQDSCGRCHGCLQVDARTHPDFQCVGMPEDKQEFPISVMQELILHLGLKPARGRYRVAIVDDADAFNEESANCFLKTLEEPPPRSLLILLGVSPDRQLPTILSRCQLIRLNALPVEVVSELLMGEGVAKDAVEAKRLAAVSGGSLGHARQLADPAITAFRRELYEGLAQPRIQSVPLAAKLVKFTDEAGKESAAKRRRAQLAIQFMLDLLRSALRIQLGQSAGLQDAKDVAAAHAIAQRIPEESLLETLERVLRADYEVERRLQLVLVLEAVCDSLGRS